MFSLFCFYYVYYKLLEIGSNIACGLVSWFLNYWQIDLIGLLGFM